MRLLALVTFFAIIGGLLVFLLRFFTGMGDGGSTYTITAFFAHTGGLNTGNPIKMVGKEIGEVGEVTLDYKKRGVMMDLIIFSDVNIPKDAELKISEKGMLGEMYLYFGFGTSKEMLKPGDHMVGTPPMGMSDLMSSAGDTIEGAGAELTQLLKGMNKLLSAPGFQENIVGTVAKAPMLVSNLSDVVSDNRENLAMAMGNVKVLTESLANSAMVLEGQLKSIEEKDLVEKLDGTLTSLNRLMNRIDNMVVDDLGETVQGASQLMTSLQMTSSEVQNMVKSLTPVISGLGKGGEGTLSKLLHDDSMHESVTSFLSSGTSLLELLESQPNSIIFGKRDRDNKPPAPKSLRAKRWGEPALEPTVLNGDAYISGERR
jgi:ABC-type transporter Mla subunit MlaD